MGNGLVRAKMFVNSETLEQISVFEYLGCDETFGYGKEFYYKLANFSRTRGTIRTILSQCRRDTQLNVYKTIQFCKNADFAGVVLWL